MNYKYYFAHRWIEARTGWEDVYLRSDTPGHQSDSFCLTITAIGAAGNSACSEAEIAAARKAFQERPFYIQGDSMFVPAEDLSKEELLSWARIWLEAAGCEVSRFIAGTYDDFKGTNWHSRFIERARARSNPSP